MAIGPRWLAKLPSPLQHRFFAGGLTMIGSMTALPGKFIGLVRRRPWRMLGACCLAVAMAISAVYGYGIWQWRRSVESLRAGKLANVPDQLRLYLTLWPDNPDVHRLAARVARMSGDFPLAEERLNNCLRMENGATEPTQIEFLLMRAQSGELDQVAQLLLVFADRGHPDGPMILETMSLTYMHNLQFGPATGTLGRWIELDPRNARAYHYRGWVLERMDQPISATEDYLKALELDPTLDRIRLRVGEMYLEDKDPLKALPHLNLLLQRDPNRPEAQARLGQCKFLQGELGEARRLLEQAVTQLPDDNAVLLCLARLDIADDQAVRAEQRLRHALTIDTSDTECRFTLLTALRMQGRDKDAADELAEYHRQKETLERANKMLQAEAKNPSQNAQAAYEIGSLLLKINHEKQGMHWMDEALGRDPNHRPTHEFLLQYFEKSGNETRAAFHRRRLTP